MQNITIEEAEEAKKLKSASYLLSYAFVAIFLIASLIFISGCLSSSLLYAEGLNKGITLVQYPAVPTPMQSYYYYSGNWNGQTVYLQLVPNVAVESLPDATFAGTLSSFYTNQPGYLSPPYTELNGESLNVWTAPSEFPGEYVVHNGDQGPQPAYGTWVVIPAQAIVSPPSYLPPIQPQGGVGTSITPYPLFAFGLGNGINVYFLTSLSTYIYEYNGVYFNWENNGWVYSTAYYGPWYPVSSVVVIPVPLLYGPPPPVVAYQPYFNWWRTQIGPFYRVYHPRWWYRHRIFIRHYTIWKRVVINRVYNRRPFYMGKIHQIINPRRGRLIFPKGARPVLGPRGRVIYPKIVHPVRVKLPPIPMRRQMPSIHPVHPISPPHYYRVPKAVKHIIHQKSFTPSKPISVKHPQVNRNAKKGKKKKKK
ncbi:MAG: hypothetical protein ACYCTB_03255 [bacterium]